jgi:hypothetical protein
MDLPLPDARQDVVISQESLLDLGPRGPSRVMSGGFDARGSNLEVLAIPPANANTADAGRFIT